MISLDSIKKKKFELDLLPTEDYFKVNLEGLGRHYATPHGYFMSVTTFLAQHSDDSWLEEWRNNIGVEKAQQLSEHAASRGTDVHLNLERYIRGLPQESSSFGILYNQYINVINRNLTKVHSIEGCLYSKKMQLAGSVDLVGIWNGELSIIDYKTSSKAKTEEMILNYFLQTTLYSMMLEEMFGIVARQLVVLIGIESRTWPQVFTVNRDKYVPMILELLKC